MARRWVPVVVAACLMATFTSVTATAGPSSATVFSADIFAKAYGWGVTDGASKFEICTTTCQIGSPGSGAGQFDPPNGIATDGSGNVYVADTVNNRIDEFSAAGAFVKAYGWGVSDGASKFETCTSTCQTGIAGAGAGQVEYPRSVATDSSGHVYVAESANQRIDEFSAAGAFVKTYGWGVSDGASKFETCTSSCQAGISGGGAGQLHDPFGLATDGSGNLYVADAVNNRIDEFSAAGAFVKAYGRGVSGGSSFETCTSSCEAGTSGDDAGDFTGPYGVAIDSAGNVYVADNGNNRIDEFSASGGFIETFGWGVSDGGTSLETCASSCIYGIGGAGAGQLNEPSAVATDSAGNVYVSDSTNYRIDEFVGLRTLHVALSGAGHGLVTGTGISCPGTCQTSAVSGSVLTLTAAPSAGSTVASWSGCTTAHADHCTVTMNTDRDVTVHFALRPPNTTITSSTIEQKRHRATFTFTATGKATEFQCALVKLPKGHHPAPKAHFTSCTSPKAYKDLKTGSYKFEVRGVNAGGTDATPAKKKFTIH